MKNFAIMNFITALSKILFFLNFIFFQLFNIFFDFNISFYGLFLIIFYLTQLVILFENTKSFLNFPSIFLTLSYIFHLGHLLVLFLGVENLYGYDMRVYTSESVFQSSIIYLLHVHFFLFLGMYIGVRNEFFKKLSKTRDLVNLSELNVIKIIGYIVLLIGLFPRLYIDIIRIQLYINGNYDLTTTINFSGLFVIISGFFHLGFLLLLIGYKNNNKLAVFILFFSISYNLLIITTGNRGDSVINIFTLLFVYLNTTKKRSYYLYFFLALFGYFFISIVSFIGEIRNLQDRDFLVLTFNFFNNFFSGSYILESISQFGVSIKTIYYSIETFPLLQNYSYGLNYLKSVFVIVPNFLGFTTRLINELTYIYYFPNHSVMGGSYIGELFYAFGYFSIVLISIIGYLISKLYIYLMKSKLNSNWISYSFSIIIILSLLWWIRDYFYVMVREVFYVSIVIFIIHNLLTKKGKYNL